MTRLARAAATAGLHHAEDQIEIALATLREGAPSGRWTAMAQLSWYRQLATGYRTEIARLRREERGIP